MAVALQMQKDKNTPITVDEHAVHEEDEHPVRHLGWLWLLLAVLLLAGIGFGLHYFKIVDFNLMKMRPEKPSEIEPWTVYFPSKLMMWKTEVTVPQTVGAIQQPVEDEEIANNEEEETIPEVFEDSFFFDLSNNDSIVVQKHERYSPAIEHSHTFFEITYI